MVNFEVGERVVCVDASPATDGRPCPYLLKEGNIYTIEEVGICPPHNPDSGKVYIRIEEIDTMAYNSIGFRPERFQRPLKKTTSIEIFKKLLVPTPETIDA